MDVKLPHLFILFLAGAALFLMAMAQPIPVQACQHGSSDAAAGVNFEIRVGPLRVRDAPNGNVIGVLLVSQIVTVTEYADADVYRWGRHASGWSALHTLDCALEYAESLTALLGDAAPDDTDSESDEAPPVDAAPPGAAAPSDPALAGADNLCNTVWTFCNTGTPEQQAYYWRLGWFTAAVERGEVPSGSPESYASGEIAPEPEPMSPEATAEP